MIVVHSFRQKQREKEIKLERSLLRELSIEWLKKKTMECFVSGVNSYKYVPIHLLEECCHDVAVEAFLLGGRFGKFGYFGESAEQVRVRCQEEEKYLIDTLYHYIEMEEIFEKDVRIQQSLFLQCEYFVQVFWTEGFIKAVKRYKLRLRS